jgi:hypothetical protein
MSARIGKNVMKNRADVGQRFTRAGARSDDEILASGAQLDGVDLVAIERVALEDVANIGVNIPRLRQLVEAAVHLE